MHEREIDIRNHMKSHYDKIINDSRVAYRLEREYFMKQSLTKEFEIKCDIADNYKSKIRSLDILLEQSNDEKRTQERTLTELQEQVQAANKLRDTIHSSQLQRVDDENKINLLINKLDMKRKRDVHSTIKINWLEKKLKQTEHQLDMKKIESIDYQGAVKGLKEKLRVSKKVRARLEKVFERRVLLRGRLECCTEGSNLMQRKVNDRVMLEKNRSRSLKSQNPPNALQLSISRSQQIMCEDKETNTTGAFMDVEQINQMRNIMFNMDMGLTQMKQENNLMRKQNNAYKHLLTAKNMGIILAATHRDLCSYPNLMEARMLDDIIETAFSNKVQTHDSLLPAHSKRTNSLQEKKIERIAGKGNELICMIERDTIDISNAVLVRKLTNKL